MKRGFISLNKKNRNTFIFNVLRFKKKHKLKDCMNLNNCIQSFKDF